MNLELKVKRSYRLPPIDDIPSSRACVHKINLRINPLLIKVSPVLPTIIPLDYTSYCKVGCPPGKYNTKCQCGLVKIYQISRIIPKTRRQRIKITRSND